MASSFRLALANDEDAADFQPSSNLDDMFSEFMRDSPAPASGKPSPADVLKEEPAKAFIVQTLTAKVVTAYKLINNENVPQGRVGLAVVQHAANDIRLILYRTKQDVLATLALQTTPNSSVHIKGEYYIQFRDNDDQPHFWNVCFDSPSDRNECLQAIGDQYCVNEETTADKSPPNGLSANAAEPKVAEQSADDSSITDAGTSKAKTALVSRMAKMGQHLPQVKPRQQHQQQVVTDSSSDSDVHAQTPHHSTATAKWKPTIASRPCGAYATPAMLATNTLIAYNPPAAAAHLEAADLLAHFTETRMQNTEVRMNLSKLESRIERVLDKIDALPLNGVDRSAAAKRSDVEAEIIALEERMLGLRKENRELRMAGEASGALRDEALQAERTKFKVLHEENEAKERVIAGLQQELQKIKADLQSLNENHEQSTLKHTQEILDLKTVIQSQEKDIVEARLLNESSMVEVNSHVPDTGKTVETIKGVLNQFYHNFQARINESADLSNEQLLKLVRTLIKTEAQNILKDM